jgi:2-dehydropantoate 2-reductase
VKKARLLVVGAGVNGSVCATGLFNAGFPVTLLARGNRLNDVRANGIIIEDPFTSRRTVARVPVIDRLDPGDFYEYVLVVVRKNQIEPLFPCLAANSSPNIVFMGNNLAGPEEFIRSLGATRFMAGFVFAGGKRDGEIIRAFVPRIFSAPFGEIDGTITRRLERLVSILRQSGFKARKTSDIVDFQTTHAASVALVARLIIRHGCDTSALARVGEELELFVDARREAHQALRALGHRIVPWSEAIAGPTPRPLQVAALRALLRTKYAVVGAAWHCAQAPDEMHQLAIELLAMTDRSGLAVPAIRRILA